MKIKKVTFIINSLGGGGAEGVCVNLANSLIDLGWEVTLVVLHLNRAVRHKQLSSQVHLIVLGKKHARSSVFSLNKFLKQTRPEKILVFNHQLAIVLVVLRFFSAFKFKLLARNISNLTQKKKAERSIWHKYIVHWLTGLFYKKVDRVVAQSLGMAEDLQTFYGVAPEKISVIHNPVSADLINHKCTGHISHQEYFLCVGRLEAVKAFDYALVAFASISKYYPSLRLKIVGQGVEEKNLREYSFRLGISDKVDYEGFQLNMLPYYKGAKATVLTSIYEGFPNVLIESISVGTPIVAFDCKSGPSEIVVEGVNGFLVRYQDTAQLAESMRLIMDSHWDSKDISKTALEFDPKIIVKKYVDALNV